MNKRCQRKGYRLCKEKKYVVSSTSYSWYHLTLKFFYYYQHVKHTKRDTQQYPGNAAVVFKERVLTPATAAEGSFNRGNRDIVQLTLSPGNDNNQFSLLQLHQSFAGVHRWRAFCTSLSHSRKVKQLMCSMLSRI